jgi:hypothetical protein
MHDLRMWAVRWLEERERRESADAPLRVCLVYQGSVKDTAMRLPTASA